MITLKDGSKVTDRRLDRLMHFDEQSREYPVRKLVANKPLRSYTWRLNTYLDQGYEGACVGFSLAHELIARPSEVKNVDANYARNIYFQAQTLDPWPGGAYPNANPFYEGTSVLAGAQHLKAAGLLKEYRWGFSLEDALLAVGYKGPGVLGTNWYEGMFEPDEKGYIHPTGNLAGGHAILIRGVDVKNKRVRLSNSWGKSWGMDGDCWLSFDDLGTLLEQNGEFCIPVTRGK